MNFTSFIFLITVLKIEHVQRIKIILTDRKIFLDLNICQIKKLQ